MAPFLLTLSLTDFRANPFKMLQDRIERLPCSFSPAELQQPKEANEPEYDLREVTREQVCER